MVKKLLALFVASAMTLGAGAVMPESVSLLGEEIKARAEVYGDFEYYDLFDNRIEVSGYNGTDAEVIIPSEINGKRVTSLGQTFYNRTGITSVTIPNGVTRIGDFAFHACKDLTSVVIPNGVTSIGVQSFSYCTSLTDITIPDTVTKIDNVAFYECSSLTNIKIPKSVSYIGNDVFHDCTSLKSVNISEGVSSIESCTFAGCTSLTNISIPNSVTSIEYYAFSGCESLESISIPNSVTNIGPGVFSGCTSLKSISIPNTVETIDYFALGFYFDYDSGNYVKIDDFTIRCASGSAAEEYAKAYNIKYEIDETLNIHTHSYTSKITKAATCTADGVRTYSCECGKSYVESIKATGHKYTSKVVKPTYDAQGYTLHTCSACGDSYKDNYKAKLTRTSIAKATVSGLKSKYYTGKAITQKPVVKLGGKTLKAGTDYTVSYKNNKAIGTATVTIKGKGKYSGSVKATFKICPKKTAVKKLTSPKTKQLKVTYNKVAGVTGYQVTYSTSSKFTKKTTKSASSTGTSKTIKKLTKGKTYYVKVRTYKTVNGTKYYSGYTAVKKIKVK